jgi:hypothetical protein
MVQGNTLLLSLDATLLACATDISIDFEKEMKTTRDIDNVGWDTFTPGQKSFAVSGGGLVSFTGRNKWWNDGFDAPVLVQFKYHTSDNADGYWEGNCWIRVYGESSSGTGFATYNFALQGHGKPTFVEDTNIPAGGIGVMVVESDFIVG